MTIHTIFERSLWPKCNAFLSFPRPNLKKQRPTSVLWSASTRTPPTISQGDLPFEVIIFVNFIPAQMPWLNWTSLGHLKNVFWKAITLTFSPIANILSSSVLRPRTNFLIADWIMIAEWFDFDINWKVIIKIEQVWPASRDGDGPSYASFWLQGTWPERDTLQVVIGNHWQCCFGRS